MKDIVFKYDKNQHCFDIDLDIQVEESLESKIALLLFTDARCEVYELPPTERNRRGFWADAMDKQTTGSKLWIISRKRTNKSLVDTRDFCQKALQPLLDEGLISKVTVFTRFENLMMVIDIIVDTIEGSKRFTFNNGATNGLQKTDITDINQ